MKLEAYLDFDGRCEEAAQFYQQALDARIEAVMRFSEAPADANMECGENPEMAMPPGSENKIMHMCMRIGETMIMASDGYCKGNPQFAGISLTLSVADDAQAQTTFDRLAEGGKVQMPLAKTFFASSFGMVADRFGVSWIVIAGAEQAGQA